MNIKAVGFYIGHVLRLLAAMMLPPLLIAFFAHEEGAVAAFALSMGITMAAGCILLLLKRPGSGGVRPAEGFITVSLSWILISLFGCLPFYFSRYIPRFVDCVFETVSGFTTTGATILTDVELLPNSLLYWRSFTHWIGGMGVLVFMMAVVPLAKGNGESMHLLRAESPGPVVGKLTAKMKDTTRVLYLIYIAMTVLLFVLLLAGGMPLFDSVVNAFATAGTGGFGIKNASIAAYPSHYLQTVIAVFMMLFGVNFNVYYFILIGKGAQALKGEEFRAYIGMVIAGTLMIALNILPLYGNSFAQALHQSFFQVSSMGMDSIVSPKLLTANEIVRYVRAMEDTTGGSVLTLYKIVDGKAEALEFSVKGEAKFLNLPLYRLKLKKNVLIAAIIRARRVIIPSGADVMQKGDTVIVVTEADRAIRDLKDIFEGEV